MALGGGVRWHGRRARVLGRGMSGGGGVQHIGAGEGRRRWAERERGDFV